MSITLSKHDVVRLEDALRSLLSPLDAADTQAWRDRVVTRACDLLGAQRGVLELVGEGVSGTFDRDYGQTARLQYTEYYHRVDVGRRRRDRERLAVWSRRNLFPRDLPALTASECYNDYLRPNDVHDSMGMTVWGPEGDQGSLYLHTDRFGTPAFGERGLELLRLLQPAFEAGVTLHRRLARESDRLAATMDRLGQPVAVFDLEGRGLHRTPGLSAALERDPEHRTVEQAMAAMAAETAGLLRAFGRAAVAAGARAPSSGRIRTALGVYRLRCAMWRSAGDAILVSVDPPAVPAAGDSDDLGRRFGLTRREAQVALLLARRRTNREIAAALSISTHTARHHTQWVLSKLGIHSRREVPRVLGGEQT